MEEKARLASQNAAEEIAGLKQSNRQLLARVRVLSHNQYHGGTANGYVLSSFDTRHVEQSFKQYLIREGRRHGEVRSMLEQTHMAVSI